MALSFDILARDKASPAFDKVSKAAERTEKRFGFLSARSHGLTAGMTAGFGKVAGAMAAVGAAGFLKGAISEASDLNETVSKSAAVFGPAQADILNFGKSAAKSLGQTQTQAIGAASQFGNMFNQLGIGQKPAAQMSKQMVTLASDFASFHNADITEVLQAQEAAFRGEYDSVQKFVPTINAAAVEQEGLRLGLAKSTKELDAQDKAIATQSLLMKGAGKAVGDFARTSGGLANQQRILSAQFGDFKASIGQIALPLVTKFVTFINDHGIPALDTVKTGVEALGAAFREGDVTSDGFVGVMERIGATAGQVFGVFKTVALPHLRDFGRFVTGTLVPKLGGFVEFVAKWPGKVITGMTTGFKTGNWAPLGKSIGNGLISALKGAGDLVGDVLDAVGDLIDRIDWAKLGSKISDGLVGMAREVDWEKVGDTLGDALISIVEKATTLAQKIGTAFKTVMNKVDWNKVGRESTDAIGRFISGIDWGRLAKTLGASLLKSLKINVEIRNTILNSAADLVEGIATSIGKAIGRWFSDAGSWLSAKGKELIGGLKSGASTESKSLGKWITSHTVTPLVGAFKDAGRWLVRSGRELVTGLKTGIMDFAKGLDSWILRAPVAKLLAPWYNAGKWLVKRGANFIAGFVTGVASFARGVPGWLMRNVINPAAGAFGRAGTWLVQHGRNFVSGFTNGVTGFMRGIGSIGRWMYNNVAVPAAKVFNGSISWLSRAGRDMIGGLTGGIALRMKGIGNWIKGNVVDPVITAVKKFFGIKSPSTVFAGIGFNLVAGLMKGLAKTNGRQIATKVFGDMPSALRSMVGKGLVGLSGLPQKALDALLGAGGQLGGAIISGGQKLGGRRVFYQGEQFDLATFQKLQKAQSLLGGAINVTQGSYERASSYSGSTHTGGGVFDVVGGNLTRIMSGLKASGLIGWIRNPSQGNWPWHIHALDPSETGRMSASARGQVADYYRGGNGLAGYEQGTPWVPNDQWAYVHRGEAVVPRDVNEARIAAGRGGGSMVDLTLRVAPGGDSALAQVVHKLVRNGVIQLSVGGKPVRVAGS